MTIEIDERISKSLQKLQEQADQRHLALPQYLDQLAESATATNVIDDSDEEFEAVLAEIDQLPPVEQSLPPDFSRADIYFDHD